MPLPTFLPGTFTLTRGTPADYRALETFHYLPGRPATWAGVWVVHYTQKRRDEQHVTSFQHNRPASRAFAHEASDSPAPLPPLGVVADAATPAYLTPPTPRLVAVGVLSYPTPTSIPRETLFGLRDKSWKEKLTFANANLRTISRVVVHPQFRSLGLASALVRCMCAQCPVRFTEALAVMSQTHPLFEAGGMKRVTNTKNAPDAPIYFIHDQHSHHVRA